jgi:hypothetical protein
VHHLLSGAEAAAELIAVNTMQLSLLEALLAPPANPLLDGPVAVHGPIARVVETADGLAWELIDGHGGAAWLDPDGWLRVRTGAFPRDCLTLEERGFGFASAVYQLVRHDRTVYRLHPQFNYAFAGEVLWVFGGWHEAVLPGYLHREREAHRARLTRTEKLKARREKHWPKECSN